MLIYESMVDCIEGEISMESSYTFLFPTRQTVVGEIGPQFVIFLINHSVWYFSLETFVFSAVSMRKACKQNPLLE